MNNAFEIDWHSLPSEVVASVAAQGTRLTTPLNHKDTMVWHRWAGPLGRPPLILLHGGWGSWTHWIKCIPALAAVTTVFAADIPGMGDSDDIGQPNTAEPIASFIASGITHLLGGGTSYKIAGFSFGGVVSAHVAALHGDRCERYTAVGAAGFGPLHHIVDGIERPSPDLSIKQVNAIHANNLKLLMLAHESSIDPLAIHIHRTNIDRGRLKSRRISLSSSLVDILPNIKARISGIWGELDTTGNGMDKIRKRREIFRTHQKNCPFDIINNTGHWIMYEAPKQFLDALKRHINHCEKPRSL